MDSRSEETFRYGNIVYIRGKNGGRYPFCGTLLVDDRIGVLVDPGAGRAKMAAVRDQRHIDILINSHFHEDHTCYNYMFPDAQLWAPAGDAPCFSSVDSYFDYACPMPPEHRAQWQQIIIDRFHYTERTPDRLLTDGEELVFGDTRAIVVHTPGHTPGHISLHFPDEGVLFLADIDLTRFGAWYGDRLSDIDALIASIQRIKEIPAKVYIGGHEAGPFEDITEAVEKYLSVIDRRENAIVEALRLPMTIEELITRYIIYGKPREPRELTENSERSMLLKHLDRLEKQGIVVKDGAIYYSV